MESYPIIGQERLLKNLRKALDQDELAHAYLLEGQKGLGKKEIAKWLATAIVCRGESPKPCHHCISCIKINSNNHPEVKWIQEEGSIGIDIIRELQKDLQLKPYEGSKKVYIIDNAEKITLQAQNSLLKSLEEPPEYATIILLTNNGSSLLQTIISRCQRLKLLSVPLQEIEDYLVHTKKIDRNRAKVLASLSNGVIGKALQLSEDDEFQERRSKVIQITRDILYAKEIEVLENIGFFQEERDYIEEILETLVTWYRDLLIYKDTGKEEFLINIDNTTEILQQSHKASLDKIKRMIFTIEETKHNLKANANFQINIEVMLLNLTR